VWMQFNIMPRTSSVVEEHAVTVLAAPVSKKAKLYDFVNPRLHENTSTMIDKLSDADVKQQYGAFIAVADEMYGHGLLIFNDKRFYAPRPLAHQIFTAPASSAASERVFSKAGLIMRPARSRLSRANVTHAGFPEL